MANENSKMVDNRPITELKTEDNPANICCSLVCVRGTPACSNSYEDSLNGSQRYHSMIFLLPKMAQNAPFCIEIACGGINGYKFSP
jgi:hypothetical protein